MGNLIWAIEAVLLGLWGFILSLNFSTPFHQCMSFAQLLISSTTLVFHALIASRNPPRAFAVSQAYACAIAALGLVYTVVLLNPSMYDVAFNSPTLLGPLPFAANVGLTWIILLLFGAVAMSIQDVNDGQKTALFLHPFGYHMLVALPCLMVMFSQNGVMSTILVFIIWALYIILELISRTLCIQTIYKDEQLDNDSKQFFLNRLWHSLGYPLRRMQAIDDLSLTQITPFIADLVGKGAMLSIVIIALLSVSGPLSILCLVLLVIAGLHQISWLSFVDWILGDYSDEAVKTGNGWPQPPKAPDVVDFKDQTPDPTYANPDTTIVPSAPTLPDIKGIPSPLINPVSAPGTGARYRFPGYQPPDLHLPLQWRDKAV